MTKPDKKRLNLTDIQKKYIFKSLGISSIEEIDTAILKLLKERLKKVTDKRQQHKIFYKIWISLCTLLSLIFLMFMIGKI